jgi:hypothetical protein
MATKRDLEIVAAGHTCLDFIPAFSTDGKVDKMTDVRACLETHPPDPQRVQLSPAPIAVGPAAAAPAFTAGATNPGRACAVVIAWGLVGAGSPGGGLRQENQRRAR